MNITWTTPPCPYYGKCGGCQLQHLPTPEYEAHKIAVAQQALDHFQITTPLEPLTRLNPGDRRRVSFKVYKNEIGFYAQGSHRLVPIKACLLLTPALNQLLEKFTSLLKTAPGFPPKFSVTALEAANGIDLLLEDVDLKQLGFEALQAFSQLPVLRLRTKFKNRIEIIFEKEKPFLIYGGHKVPISAGDFCQVSEKTDRLFEDIVTACAPDSIRGHCHSRAGGNDNIRQADLFAGRGTLALPLLKQGQVDAFEMEEGAVETLSTFPVNALKRQLFKDPLSAEECSHYNRIVINPPREGAIHQVRQLAQSTCRTVLYISCNPKTFARDAHTLIKGGYHLEKILPFDQFIWSNHLELIGMFEKNE